VSFLRILADYRQVKQTLGNPRFKTPKNGNEVIESKNIPRLKDAQWLSDDIMAYYVQLIGARNAADPKLPTLHCFNTFFYTKIEKDPTSHASVRRWTKKVSPPFPLLEVARPYFLSAQEGKDLVLILCQVDIFSKDMVLIPINVGNMHWVAAVINFKQKRIEYFDSMGVSQHASREIFDVRHPACIAP
jgi:sentrin-specific protease 1